MMHMHTHPQRWVRSSGGGNVSPWAVQVLGRRLQLPKDVCPGPSSLQEEQARRGMRN